MLSEYTPIGVLFLIAGALALVVVGLGHFLGPKNDNAWKRTTWECGSEPIGPVYNRFGIKYYVIAILFIIFDLEVVFMVPWAVLFKDMGWAGFVEMMVFVGVLVIGLTWVWRKGALEWQ